MIDSIGQFSSEFVPTHEILNLIAEIDEFKGEWKVLQNLSPERLSALRRVAKIESVGSSTRIEGVRLSDREVETLLAGLKRYSFKSRDEEEVAGYAEAMELIVEILTLLKDHAQLTIAEIESLTRANRNTLKVRLRELVQTDLIEQNGKARATFYRLKT